MSRLLVIAAALAVLLAACAPFTATLDRNGGTVVVTVESGGTDVGAVGLTAIGAGPLGVTDDRCGVIEGAVSCDLGDLAAGAVAVVVISGEDVSCIATGFVGGAVSDYRLVRCRVQ